MDELQARLTTVQDQIAAEKAKGAARDNDFIAELEQTEAEILKAMDEATKQAQIEEKVQADPIPFAVAGVDFTKMPAELITVIDLVNKADRRNIYAQHDADIEALKKSQAAEVDSLNRHIADLQQIIETGKAANASLVNENGNLRDHTSKQKLEIDDLTAKLANAAAQIDELKSQKTEQKLDVIETEADEAAQINDAIDKLYVKIENFGSINKVTKPDGTFERVKTADLEQWTAITPPTLFGGSDATGTFQGDTEDQPQDTGSDTPTPPTLVGDTFREEVQDALNPDGGDAALPAVVGPTREEFEALEQKVEQLQRKVFGEVAA